MKHFWITICLICVELVSIAQSPLSLKDSADKLMATDPGKALPIYQQFIKQHAKNPQQFLYFLYAAYDSIYFISGVQKNFFSAEHAAQQAFELARKYNDTLVLNDRLTFLVKFYKAALDKDWQIPYKLLQGKNRQMILPIRSVTKLKNDSNLVIISAGEIDGLHVGQLIECIGVKQPFLEIDRSSNILGRGTIISVSANNATARVLQTYSADSTDNIYPGDMVLCTASPFYAKELGAYQFLAEYNISFLDNYRQEAYHQRQLAYYPIEGQEKLLDSFYLKAVKEVAEMLKGDTILASSYAVKIGNGFLQGKWLAEALEETRIEHIHAFLKYVERYPGKYYGQRFKFSEVYATWLINNSPLHELDLMKLLVNYKGKPFFKEILKAYDSSITTGKNWIYWKNNFLDSLDNGILLPGNWEIINLTSKLFKDPDIITWKKLLEGRVAANRSDKKTAVLKLAEAQQEFASRGMDEEVLFVKNQLLQVNNQRVAKVAVQTSHFLPYSISFSPDGKYFATYGDDYTIKIWDAKLVRQVTTINAHNNSINKVAFSFNNRYFVSCSDDETIKVWDTKSLQLYKSINAGYAVKFAALNKVGDKIIVAGSDSCIKTYDFLTGKVDSSYRIHKAKINAGDYNPEYQQIFYSGGRDSLAYITNIETGEWTRWFKSGGKVQAVRASHDRQFVAVLGSNGEIKVWRNSGKFLGRLQVLKKKFGGSSDIISGFDISTTKKMIAFVDENKSLCFASLDTLNTGNHLAFNLRLDNDILEMAFHPSGNSLVLSTRMGKMYIVNLLHFNMNPNDRIQWTVVGSKSQVISSMGFSSDSKMFVYQSGSTYLLNLATGKSTSWGEEGFGQLRGNINFTRRDSAILFVPYDGRRVHEQNVYTGDTINTLHTDPDYIAFQDLSPDHKLFVSLFNKKAFAIYDFGTKEHIYTIPLDSATHNQLSGAMFIPGSNVIVVNEDVDNSISFYKMTARMKTLDADKPVLKPFYRYTSKQKEGFYSLVYDPLKKEVIAACQDNNLYFFDSKTGVLKDTVNFNYFDKDEGLSIIRLFPDGKKLLVGMNTRIFVFDLVTKKIINRFDEENYVLSSAQVSPDGTLTAIGTFTGVINFYENTNFSKVLEIQTFIDKGPVWITSDNYYLSSKSSLKELYFKYNNTLYPFDQFDINFNRPDKVLEKLGKIEPALLAAYKEAWNKRFRKSGIPSNRLRPDFKVPEAKILNAQDIPAFTTNDPVIRMALELSDGDADIVSYNIWVNGIPEYGTRWRKLKAIGKHVVINDSIRITGSNNIIQVGCKNSYGVESLREKFEVKNYVVDSIERKTYLYIVSVSNYSDARYNLKYAVKDGRDLAQAFKLRYKMNLIIDTLFNEKATLQNILAWRKELLKTNINDRVIIYVSGHGVLDKNFDFYYATSEIDFRDPSLKGLAYEDIEKLLDSIPAREKLLLMDACHSGEVDKETVVNGTAIRPPIKTDPAVVVYKSKGLIVEQGKKRLGLSNSFELMQDLFANLNSGNGTVVISAAAGNSYAYESDAWKNGVFTYSILHGLVDKVADMDNDKRVSLSEIQRYVSSQVQRLTKGAQKPTARQENLENDWIIW